MKRKRRHIPGFTSHISSGRPIPTPNPPATGITGEQIRQALPEGCDPYLVECPHCGAQPTRDCWRSEDPDHGFGEPHTARIHAAAWNAGPEAWLREAE